MSPLSSSQSSGKFFNISLEKVERTTCEEVPTCFPRFLFGVFCRVTFCTHRHGVLTPGAVTDAADAYLCTGLAVEDLSPTDPLWIIRFAAILQGRASAVQGCVFIYIIGQYSTVFTDPIFTITCTLDKYRCKGYRSLQRQIFAILYLKPCKIYTLLSTKVFQRFCYMLPAKNILHHFCILKDLWMKVALAEICSFNLISNNRLPRSQKLCRFGK